MGAWDHRTALDEGRSPEAWGGRAVAWRLAVSRWRRARLALRNEVDAVAEPLRAALCAFGADGCG